MKMQSLRGDLNNRPELIVLVGVPGSGKSTWTERFTGSSQKSYNVVSSDAVIDQVAAEKGISYTEAYASSIGYATAKTKQNLREAFERGDNIIYDRTNLSRKSRRGLLDRAKQFGYKAIAVVFNTEDKEVERRLKVRAETTGKFIPPAVMKDMYAKWESPTREEGFEDIIKA